MFRYLITKGGNISSYLISLLLTLPIILLSLSVHEASHAWMANKLGDPTARNLGRLTLNPFKHLDLVGFICMLLFGFGWANPVPVNSRYFKKPRRDMALTAAAGPLSNIVLGFIFVSLYEISYLLTVRLFPSVAASAPMVIYVWLTFLQMGAELNVYLAVFNLIPVPPLDGSRLFYIFLPVKWYFGIMKYENIFRSLFSPCSGSAFCRYRSHGSRIMCSTECTGCGALFRYSADRSGQEQRLWKRSHISLKNSKVLLTFF